MNQLIMQQIIEERQRQDAKWGVPNHDSHTWLVILLEELGEVSHEVLSGNNAKMRQELVQVAAVTVAWLEQQSNKGGTSALRKDDD